MEKKRERERVRGRESETRKGKKAQTIYEYKIIWPQPVALQGFMLLVI